MLSESLKREKEVVDRQVENALLKRALGYEFKETTYELTEDGKQFTEFIRFFGKTHCEGGNTAHTFVVVAFYT